MQVQVPEAWWNDAWRKGVYQLKKRKPSRISVGKHR